METCIIPTTPSAPPMPPLEIAASEKLASGVSTSLSEANVWQPQSFTPELRWGNDYMHARYYSTALDRFVSVDPVKGNAGSSQTWNRYSYALNNPIKFIDPDGRDVAVAVRPVSTFKASGHAYLVVTPTGGNRTSERFMKYLEGENRFTLSGGPDLMKVNGRMQEVLVSHVSHKMDEMGDATQLFTVQPPDGLSMEEFEQRVLDAFESYESGSLFYNNMDADFHGKNSNAFTSGVLDSAGVDLGSLPPIMDLGMPGWGDPIQMKVSPGNEGDTEAWLERQRQQMAAQRAGQ